jgi:hypothetical protein
MIPAYYEHEQFEHPPSRNGLKNSKNEAFRFSMMHYCTVICEKQ